MYDVLQNLTNKEIKCLDLGFVALVDVMPRLVPEEQKTADYAIVQAARVSYGDGTKSVNEDKGLIRYLMRHVHSTPFEMVEFKFHMKLPIFCARQIIRHRTVSVNEYSGRYSVMKDEFYFPNLDNLKLQSKTNKQGGADKIDAGTANDFLAHLDELCNKSYQAYIEYLDKGISREQARMILPLNLYCVHVDTPILTHDLKWVKAGDLQEGDPLLGFEEYPGRGRGSGRRLMPSTVANFSIKKDDLYKIILSNGDELICNGEHQWLGCYVSGSRRTWLETKQIAKNPNLWRLLKTFNVWKSESSYDWGFLSAAFDGEGYITYTTGNGKSVGFVQKDNPLLSRVRKILGKEGIRWSEFASGAKTININILGGLSSVLEFLGRARPPRLLANWMADTNGGLFPKDTPTIISVEPIGKGEIASFSTSSKTYFANGYPCHNTEWYWKVDLKNLFHFLGLRCDTHAQWETRVFAEAMLNLIQPIVPMAVEAWNDYNEFRGAVKLTRLEIDALLRSFSGQVVKNISSDNKREQAEWAEKALRMGLTVGE